LSNYAKTNSADYVVDLNTKAVININNTEYERILHEREQAKAFAEMRQDIAFLKAELETLKQTVMGNSK